MKRLTYQDKDGGVVCPGERNSANGSYDIGDAERLEIVREIKTNRLRELAKAEKDGRLEVLPCKVGDHILADGREAIVVWFFGYKTGRYLHAQFLDNAECADIPFYEIGKNLSLTREEAEVALAQKGGTHEDSGSL